MVGPWPKAWSSSALANKFVEFSDVVRMRRMTRSFTSDPIDSSVLVDCIDLASRAPSAGKAQGWNLLLWEGDETQKYWDVALPQSKRADFSFPGLLRAPVIALSLADPDAYLSRYAQDDKKSTGLGEGAEKWVAPYWTIDASFSTMTLLLALENCSLGALFFAHANEDGLREAFAIPQSIQILGTIAIGHVAADETPKGRSAGRVRRDAQNIVHRTTW